MNILEAIQRHCRRTNIAVPSTVVGSTDTQVLQLMELLEEEAFDLISRGTWEVLVNEEIHTTTATESQGEITTITDDGFQYIKNNTIWDRTEQLPVEVIDGQDWQALQAFGINGPRYHVRIRGGKLLSEPSPPANNTWAFEWVSNNWLANAGLPGNKDYITDDTDVIRLPEQLLIMGLRWRWKKEKGLDYEEDFNTYERMVTDALGRQGVRSVLKMDNNNREMRPGIAVPQGTWNL